jgi:hypothetical protein
MIASAPSGKISRARSTTSPVRSITAVAPRFLNSSTSASVADRTNDLDRAEHRYTIINGGTPLPGRAATPPCGSINLPGPKNLGQPRVRRQPGSGLGRWPLGPQIGAAPPRVHVTLVLHLAAYASKFEWRRPGPKPRVRSADPRQRRCDSRRRSSRRRPDQESPIDPAQGRARGQTTPPLARPLQNQPSRPVDGVPAREGESLPRLQATNPPASTKTRKLRLLRQTRPPRTRTATGLPSAMG